MRLSAGIRLKLAFCVVLFMGRAAIAPAQDFTEAYFVGHLTPDTDAIAAALAAASFYGGAALRPGALNRETSYVLARFGLEPPPLVDEVAGKRFVLVDHNERSHMHPSIPPEGLAGIIDHHPLAEGTVATPRAIYVEIRPWGSTCTVVARRFLDSGRTLTRPVAGVLLAGLLSDTQILMSPSTSAPDSALVDTLAVLAGVGDWRAFGRELLAVKSDVSGMSDREIVLGDFKSYEIAGLAVGFGVAETVNAAQLLGRKAGLRAAMAEVKAERGFDLMFFAVVEALAQTSYLLVLEGPERQVARDAFGQEAASGVLTLEHQVSRKLQFIPSLQRALARR
jgi:manganese-dependent inorganic pyrophosphatase